MSWQTLVVGGTKGRSSIHEFSLAPRSNPFINIELSFYSPGRVVAPAPEVIPTAIYAPGLRVAHVVIVPILLKAGRPARPFPKVIVMVLPDVGN